MKNIIFGGVLLFVLSQIVTKQSLEALRTLPPVIVLVVVVVGGVCVLRSRKADTGRAAGRFSRAVTANDIATGIHEAGHGVAVKRGRMKLKKMEITGDGGVTCFDLGKVKEGSPEYLRGVMAGAEAEAAYLVKYHGLSLRQARRHAAHGAGSDMAEFRSYGGGAAMERKVRRDTRRFVQSNWRTIERNGRKLAERGKMTRLS